MALKGDRHEFQTDISFFCNVAAERGVILVHSGGGSGASMDDTNAVVTLHTGAIGLKPAGLLLNDVIDVNLTQFGHLLNWFKDETLKGGKCTLLRKGWVVTNKVTGTPVAGDKAYLAVNGLVTPSATGSPPLVGAF
jgi:hypothetical protein